MNSFFSPRVFKLWAYTVSHSFLIIRSPMTYEDVEGYNENISYNIDIEFTSVVYLDIPNILHGIRIKEINHDVSKQFMRYKDFKIFEIESENQKYYIIAGNYLIGTNKWTSESRIDNVTLKYETILKTS